MMRALRQGFRCRVRDRLKNRELAAAWTDLSEELQAQSSGVARVRNPARRALMARLRVGAASTLGSFRHGAHLPPFGAGLRLGREVHARTGDSVS